jgi:hypothetical protein
MDFETEQRLLRNSRAYDAHAKILIVNARNPADKANALRLISAGRLLFQRCGHGKVPHRADDVRAISN